MSRLCEAVLIVASVCVQSFQLSITLLYAVQSETVSQGFYALFQAQKPYPYQLYIHCRHGVEHACLFVALFLSCASYK